MEINGEKSLLMANYMSSMKKFHLIFSTLLAMFALQTALSTLSAQVIVRTADNNIYLLPINKIDSITFETVIENTGIGTFQVSDDKYVHFASGNLQYTISTNTWTFASEQYEYIGTDNVSGGTASSSEKTGTVLADKIDLFGWSGDTGSAAWGISSSNSDNDIVSVYGGDFAEWGTNIGDGKTYRTLTASEWSYLLGSRTNAAAKRGFATITLNSTTTVAGFVLLPEDWTLPSSCSFTPSIAAYTDNAYTLTQWQAMEDAGAVFLPAAGCRNGLRTYLVQSDGNYWSATANSTTAASYMIFAANTARVLGAYQRFYGRSVRLVQDIAYTISLSAVNHGNLSANKTTCAAGETVTLTLTPDAANGYIYTKGSLSVTYTDADGSTQTVATTKQTDGTCTFTMPSAAVTVSATFGKYTVGKFLTSDGGYLVFASGNLRCKGLTTADTTWFFAEHQYDYLGTSNLSSSKLANEIDLFEWSNASGPAYGISISTSCGNGEFVDWGKNAIGRDTANTWRTPTNAEWAYMIGSTRSTLYGCARIALDDAATTYANGLLFLPDNWECPDGITFTKTTNSYTTNTYTLTEWQLIEDAGAVFLPAGGMIDNDKTAYISCANSYGNYWSSTKYSTTHAYCLHFGNKSSWVLSITYGNRRYGRSVRLVKAYYYVTIPATPTHGTLTVDKTEGLRGEKVTLTTTPETGYVLKDGYPKVTLTDGTEQTLTPVTGEDGTYTFIMPDGAVTVSAEFEQTYTINLPTSVEHGKITADKATGVKGETVTLTVTPDSGYEIDGEVTITYTDDDGNEQIITATKGEGTTYTFIMPEAEVNVSAAFK